jgi:hypothetical protein
LAANPECGGMILLSAGRHDTTRGGGCGIHMISLPCLAIPSQIGVETQCSHKAPCFKKLHSPAEHRWKNIQSVLYNGKTVLLNAGDTKGAQRSIFDDGLDDGSFWIEIGRNLEAGERAFLADKYGHLAPEQRGVLVKRLSSITTGEMEPHYIMWYGFYEGHTGWRADPLAIAFIFGLRSLEELEQAFPGGLYEALTEHYSRTPAGSHR